MLSDPNKIIDFTFLEFPQHLLIPSQKNTVKFRATNYSNKKETFQFQVSGENLEIQQPDPLQENIGFEANEQKEFEINVTPLKDGTGKLIITLNWMKLVEYTVKVQKVRDQVSKNKMSKILKKISAVSSAQIDQFRMEDFKVSLSMGDVKALKKSLKDKKKKYESYQASIQNQTDNELPASPEVSLKDIDEDIKKLAKGYLFNGQPEKAFEQITLLSSTADKSQFYNHLLKAYSHLNLDEALSYIKGLADQDQKFESIHQIGIEYAKIDPERASRIALLIEKPEQKENLIKEIVLLALEEDPRKVLKITHLIEDLDLKIKIICNIAKKLHENNQKPELINSLQQLIDLILNSALGKVKENNFGDPYYNFLKDAIQCIAEAENPARADQIIEKIADQELKEKIAMDLFKILYKMVDEVRTKYEPTVVFSQYYLFNTFTSKITKEIEEFAMMGGNVCSNALKKEYEFKALFLSLFGFNFSVFPTLERVYIDLKHNSNRSIGYYVYPSKNAHDEIEGSLINKTLKLFFEGIQKSSHPITVYNMDFIPYLGKPTVIVGSDPEINDDLKTKVSTMGDSINFTIDDSLFEGGKTRNNLKEIFPPNICKVVNLVLSYEFINDYNIFKSFIQTVT